MAGATTIVEGTIAGIAAMPLRDILATQAAGAVAATMTSAGLGCTVLATLDPVLVHAIVELLAGGNGAEAPPTVPRAATSIDQQYAHIVVTLAASAIESEWAGNGFGAMRAARLDGTIPVDICGPKVHQVGAISVAVGLFGLRGTMTIALPPAAIDTFAKSDRAVSDVETAADPTWSTGFQRELGRAPVRVEAYLEAHELSLGAIAQLRAGQVLTIPSAERARVSLTCDGRTLCRGELGQDEDHYSLRIDELVADALPTSTSEPRARNRRLPLDLARAS